jgi:class 3 adenylate cyclase/predicted ATPase
MLSIADWLAELGLGQYAARFAEQDIDESVVGHLTDQDLRDLGVFSLGHRRKILHAISQLGGGPAQTSVAVRAAAAPAHVAAERRQLTVLFCDLVGSTALSDRLDPEDMREVIRAYQRSCASAVANYDGFVARYLGDGILAYFGFPHAHEDDAERAVRTGLDMVTSIGRIETRAGVRLEARVGIATGLVVVGERIGEDFLEEHDVVGTAPNVAARLQALAEPGTVVIAGATRRLLGETFDLRDLGQQDLKGLSEPVAVWSVAGIAASDSRFEVARAARLTHFVGRERETELLLERQRLAWEGHGQLVLISGDAGIGKSRIAAWLGDHLEMEAQAKLRFQCSPYHANSALFPFIVQLERAAGFASDDSPARRLDKLETMLASTPHAATDVPLLAALLSIPLSGRYPELELSPAQQRRQTIAALLDKIVGKAQEEPVLIVFEDAHWADASSLEFLDLAIERIRRLPILIVVTYRTEFDPPWASPPHARALNLGRLGHEHVRAMVERVAGGRSIPAEVMELIVAKTDGIPLFVEELTKAVLELEFLVEDAGHFRLVGPLPPLAIPDSLKDSLTARLDRLGSVKEIAQVGAVIGREFSFSLLKRLIRADETALQAGLEQLEDAELVFRTGEPPEASYTFKHALVQEAAYESLLKSRRHLLHWRIAEALRDHFASVAETEPELIAQHFTQAGHATSAIEWWGRAGERALRRSAVVEAIAHLGQALALAEGLGDAPAQRPLQLRLQISYGNAMMWARGYGAPETTAAFERAHNLAAEVGDTTEIFSAYYGLWVSSYVRGALAPAQALAAEFLRDAERRPGSPQIGVAHRICGVTRWFEGDYMGARSHIEQALAAWDPDRDRELAFGFGQDVGVAARFQLALVLYPLGEVDRARSLAEEGLELARRSGHIPSIAYGHFHMGLLEALRRDPARALPHAEAQFDLGREHGLLLWLPVGTFLRGWARWHAGEREAGEEGMREGIALLRVRGINNHMPLLGVLQAEVEAQLGRVDVGLAILDEHLAEIGRTGQRAFEAEQHRQRAELLLLRGPANAAEAECAYRRALAVASAQHTRIFALRAALGLASLCRAMGRCDEARVLLASAKDGLSEKSEVPEVRMAGMLFASLD